MSDNRTTTFFRGIPTEPDVKRLEEAFGVPKIGTEIKYKAIADTIREAVGSHRYQSVVVAWRKRLENNHRVVLGTISGLAYVVLDGHGVANLSGATIKSALRKSGKAVKFAEIALTHELAPEDKRVAEHVRNVGAALRLAAATEAKRLPATV